MTTARRLSFLALLLALASGCRDAPSRDTAADAAAQAVTALASDRPWQAARLLRPFVPADLDLETRLLAARAEAEVGSWPRVLALLADTDSLDALKDAQGLYLLARAHQATGDLDAARTRYDAFLSASGTSASPGSAADLRRAAARLRRALVQVQQGEDRRLANAAPDVSPAWRAVLEAEARARSGDAAGVEALAGRAADAESGQRLQAARILAARQSGDLPAARALASRAHAQASTDEARADFALTAAQLAATAGDSVAARTHLRQALSAAPASQAAQQAAALLGETDPADAILLAASHRALGLNEDAADAFRRWLDADLGTPAQQADVRFQAADALFDAQRYDTALALLTPILDRIDARDLQAGILSRTGRADEAAEVYLDLATADPAPNLYFAADALHQGGSTARADAIYRQIEREHPGTRWAGLAAMRRAGQAFLESDYALAARLWDAHRASQPDSPHALRSSYWAGRALAESGDTQAAAERFRDVRRQARDSYYALLASDALGEPFWPLPMQPSPPPDATAAQAVAQALRGVDVLRAAGFDAAANAEVDRAVARVGRDQRYALAEALVARGYGRRAIQISHALGGGTNARRLRILYPFPFQRMITAEAQASGVDPLVAAALIRQESQFEVRATSHVGARGLMQLMPATARTIADEARLDNWTPDRLYLPETNVHLGTRYVEQQAASYDGSLPAVFAAYNAGPHQVDAWKTFPEYGRDALFTERIPFRETRDYVKVLTRNHAVYQGLYGSD